MGGARGGGVPWSPAGLQPLTKRPGGVGKAPKAPRCALLCSSRSLGSVSAVPPVLPLRESAFSQIHLAPASSVFRVKGEKVRERQENMGMYMSVGFGYRLPGDLGLPLNLSEP